ncbi:hypothetical protein EU538_05285 [Candidatus Thorarchaeota archaeon]|jgi:Fe2+ or Zn2+ uptake regulation protein|nr:MAG: hypothetical protein EU538_05285 [Candidatus Thorarchaeota archaeon]
MSEEVTELDRKILEVIIRDSHRPSAITNILQKRGIDCTQNQVVQSLNGLEEKGLVERYTSKTWVATSDAEDYVE